MFFKCDTIQIENTPSTSVLCRFVFGFLGAWWRSQCNRKDSSIDLYDDVDVDDVNELKNGCLKSFSAVKMKIKILINNSKSGENHAFAWVSADMDDFFSRWNSICFQSGFENINECWPLVELIIARLPSYHHHSFRKITYENIKEKSNFQHTGHARELKSTTLCYFNTSKRRNLARMHSFIAGTNKWYNLH